MEFFSSVLQLQLKNWKWIEEEYVTEVIFTHRNVIKEETIQQTKDEMSKMRENGYILHKEAMREFQEEHRRYPNWRFYLYKNY